MSVSNPFPLGIKQKTDSWEKQQLLQNVDSSFKYPADDFNKISQALEFLYENSVVNPQNPNSAINWLTKTVEEKAISILDFTTSLDKVKVELNSNDSSIVAFYFDQAYSEILTSALDSYPKVDQISISVYNFTKQQSIELKVKSSEGFILGGTDNIFLKVSINEIDKNLIDLGDTLQFFPYNSSLDIIDRSSNENGKKGFKVIRSGFNFSDIPVDHQNSRWELRESHDLGGNTINIPSGVVLDFKGGFLYNGTINLNGASVIGEGVFNDDITLTNNIDDSVLDLKWFNVSRDNVDVSRLNELFLFSGFSAIKIPSGNYTVNGTIQNPKALDIFTDGVFTINAKDSTSPIALQVGEIDTTLIETLSSTYLKGSKIYTFTTHSLVPGDIVCIIDDSVGSFSSYRDGYKKGEYLKVFSVSGNDVTFEKSVSYDYDVGSVIHKCVLNEFSVNGNIKIIAPTINNSTSVKFICIKDSVFTNIKIENGSFTCLSLTKCFNIYVDNQIQQGARLTGLGGDYGVAVVNSQKITLKGHFKSSRHAVTTGGDNDFPELHCKDIIADGIFESDESGNVAALDTHGNIDNFIYRGIIKGGVNVGGSNGKVEGIIEAGFSGVAIHFAEMKNYNHNFSNCIIKGNGLNPNDAGRGTIDLGGNSVPNTYAENNGCLNFSNITIDASASSFPIKIRNQAASNQDCSNVTINLSGLKVLKSSATLIGQVRNYTGAGNEFKSIDISGVDDNANNQFSFVALTNTQIIMSSISGRQLYNGNTSATFINGTVTFNYPLPYTPSVVASLENNLAGGNLNIAIGVITATGFTYQINTTNGANMGTASNQYFNWIAT